MIIIDTKLLQIIPYLNFTSFKKLKFHRVSVQNIYRKPMLRFQIRSKTFTRLSLNLILARHDRFSFKVSLRGAYVKYLSRCEKVKVARFVEKNIKPRISVHEFRGISPYAAASHKRRENQGRAYTRSPLDSSVKFHR